MITKIGLTMTGLEYMLAILGTTSTLLLMAFVYFFIENRKLTKEANMKAIETTESKLTVSISALTKSVNEIHKTVSGLVSKPELKSEIKSLKSDLQKSFDEEKLILNGKIEKAEGIYLHIIAEARGIKRRVELLFGKIIEKFPEFKNLEVENEK